MSIESEGMVTCLCFLHLFFIKESYVSTARLHVFSAVPRLQEAVQCALHGAYFKS